MTLRTVTYKINMDLAGVKNGSRSMLITMKTMEQDAKKAEATMQKLGKTLGDQYGAEVKVAVDQTRSLQAGFRDVARDTNRVERNFQRLTREYKHMAQRAGQASDRQEVMNALFRLGSGATLSQKKEVVGLVREYQRLRAEATKTQGSMRSLRGQAQNVGFQLQDIAVQAQMGTNALVILGQQGSQLAAGFGAKGALIGAGIAVVSAALFALMPNLKDTTTDAEKLEKAMDSLGDTVRKNKDGVYEFSDSLLGLNDVSKIVVAAELEAQMVRARQAVEFSTKAITKAFNGLDIGVGLSTFDDYLDAIDKGLVNTPQFSDAAVKLGKEFGASSDKAWLLGQNIFAAFSELRKAPTAEGLENLQIKLAELVNGNDKVSEKTRILVSDLNEYFAEARSAAEITEFFKKRLEDLSNGEGVKVPTDKGLLNSLQEQLDLFGKSKLSIDLYNISKSKMSEDDKKAATLLAIRLNAERGMAEALKKKKDEIDQLNDKNDKLVDQGKKRVEQLQATQAKLLGVAGAEEKWLTSLKEVNSDLYDNIKALEDRNEALEEQRKRQDVLSKFTTGGQLDALRRETSERLKYAQGNQEAITNIMREHSRERIKINGTIWEKYAVRAQEALENTDEVMLNSIDRMVSSFGNAMTQMIFDAKSPGDALKEMFEGGLRSMVQFFSEWAAQRLLMWALDKTMGSQTQSGAAGAMGANTGAKVAEAGLNAFAATAAIPIVGPALAPGAAQAAVAFAAPMAAAATALSTAAIGMYDKGGRIPAGGAGIVAEIGDELVGGTMIYNGSPNSLGVTGREQTARQVGGGGFNLGGVTINSSGNASPEAIGRAVVRAIERKSKRLDKAIFDSMDRGRTNRGQRFNA